MVAVITAESRKAFGQDAATHEAAELALNETWKWVPITSLSGLLEEGEQVIADDSVQHRALSSARRVGKGLKCFAELLGRRGARPWGGDVHARRWSHSVPACPGIEFMCNEVADEWRPPPFAMAAATYPFGCV